MKAGPTHHSSPTISYRALLIGALLIPINLYWLTLAETIYQPVFSTLFTLFYNVTFTLFLLVVLNALLNKYAPNAALQPIELLIIYVMNAIATGIFGHDLLLVMVQHLTSFWFVTPENEWMALFGRHIPEWATVYDSTALQGYHKGETTLYIAEHFKPWLIPALGWGGFLIVLFFVIACINVIIRKQWTENEKLAYPVIQLPMEMAKGGTGLLSNRMLWIGFGIAGTFDLMNGLHGLWPVAPNFAPLYNLGRFFTEKPWNAVGWLPMAVYPFVVGMAYFLPLNLAFSAWFFHLVWKADLVYRNAMGIWATPGPFRSYQTAGSWIILAILPLWSARLHLKQVLREIIRGKSPETAANEAMSYRSALTGIILGVVALVMFLGYAGMTAWVVLLFLLIYILYAVAIARIRAEIGPPAHDAEFMGPDQMLLNVVGPRRIGVTNIAMFSHLFWMCRAYRSHPVGHQIEGFKMAQLLNAPSRHFLIAMILASIVGTFAGFWALLHNMYHFGADNVYHNIGDNGFRMLDSWIQHPRSQNYPMLRDVGIGAGITIALRVLHQRFLAFPFHPVGYAVACGWMMGGIWFSVFVAWLTKWAILKFGGIQLYRRMVPFFIGIILGQHVIGSLWTIFGEIRGQHVYRIFPYFTEWGW